MENYEKAEKDYMSGMKYREIAEKYGTSINTVKSWKKRYGWDRKGGAPKNRKVCTQNEKSVHLKAGVAPVQLEDGTRETLQNDDLSSEQQIFCIYYIRSFNAAQSYQKAYRCKYSTALTNGPALLKNTRVKKEIERLKEIKRQQIVVGEEDILELQMRIACSDIGDYLTFGQENGTNVVHLYDSDTVDTQLIQEVKQGKNGISVKLADKQKAMDWLSKYFLMHPDDKYKAEFDRKRADMEEKKIESDGFMEALKEGTAELFKDAGEEIET